MMSLVLADLADLPQKVTDAGWTGEDDAAPRGHGGSGDDGLLLRPTTERERSQARGRRPQKPRHHEKGGKTLTWNSSSAT